MTLSSDDELHDAIPLGWVLTYFARSASGADLRIGVVAGLPVRDRETGVESIPVIAEGGGARPPEVWVAEDDVIGFAPRRARPPVSDDHVFPEPSYRA